MKNILLICCFTFSIVIHAQVPDTVSPNPDTVRTYNFDSLYDVRVNGDAEQRQQDIERNMRSILALQEKNEEKQRKAAMVRIAIGVGFLILLVIGLRRRRKK